MGFPFWIPPPPACASVAGLAILVADQPRGRFFFGEGHGPYLPVSTLKPRTLLADNAADHSNREADMTSQGQTLGMTAPSGGDMITDRGRGPEIARTRITIYRIMDFQRYKYSISDIAKELDLTEGQVRAAVEYIQEHQEESDRQYGLIMDRMKPQIPPEGERDRIKAREELRDRLRARLEGKGAHDHTVGP